jgi:hypothetical protein
MARKKQRIPHWKRVKQDPSLVRPHAAPVRDWGKSALAPKPAAGTIMKPISQMSPDERMQFYGAKRGRGGYKGPSVEYRKAYRKEQKQRAKSESLSRAAAILNKL